MQKKHKHPGVQGHLNTPFQKAMVKKHSKKKKDLIGRGGNKSTGGGAYKYKVSFKRSKSAPPMGESVKGKNAVKKVLKEMQYYDLSQMNMRDHLNHNLWANQDVLHGEVSAKLTEIAKDFFASLKLPKNIEIIDIKFTGSLANYNWTENSDIDLHIVAELDGVSKNPDLLRSYIHAKRSLWNDNHDIEIRGHEVEIYVEDTNEMHYSSGAYSISNGEWIVKPSPRKPMIDDRQVLVKMGSFQSKIMEAGELFDRGEFESAYLKAEELLDKLKKMRTSGLEHGGEFSVENLVYKGLRKIGVLQDLHDLKYDAYDEKMSLKSDQKHATGMSRHYANYQT